MTEPAYNPRKRFVGELDATSIATIQGWAIARYNDNNSTTATNEGNARLSAASDNAVLELAERLGCNAVELAERLENGGLVKVAAFLEAIVNGTGEPETRAVARAALSHLTTPAPR
ncbi:hypothetical protein [Azospirillum tabaci]|uniref:hypothetical protein n=1 Tax=Azospirillum tabaci TaxID=2752310 RepID=UPI00166123DE|nr:hypothetical protein [Azospirillum tabaci]